MPHRDKMHAILYEQSYPNSKMHFLWLRGSYKFVSRYTSTTYNVHIVPANKQY